MSKQAPVVMKEKSNDQVKDEKASILDNESNAMSLGKTKVAYSRSGEEEDTLIVRDLYSGTRFDRFGVKGTAQLERVFYAIVALVHDNRKTLLKRMRYGGDALRNLLDILLVWSLGILRIQQMCGEKLFDPVTMKISVQTSNMFQNINKS